MSDKARMVLLLPTLPEDRVTKTNGDNFMSNPHVWWWCHAQSSVPEGWCLEIRWNWSFRSTHLIPHISFVSFLWDKDTGVSDRSVPRKVEVCLHVIQPVSYLPHSRQERIVEVWHQRKKLSIMVIEIIVRDLVMSGTWPVYSWWISRRSGLPIGVFSFASVVLPYSALPPDHVDSMVRGKLSGCYADQW